MQHHLNSAPVPQFNLKLRGKIAVHWLLLLLLASLTPSSPAAPDQANPKIKVLLVTGGHDFDKTSFFKVFTENPEIAVTFASHDTTNNPVFERDDLLSYDVVALYDIRRTITEKQKIAFLSLFKKGIGLVVLHHAIVSYQHWPDYEKIIGGKYPEEDGKYGAVTPQVGYQHDVEIPVTIVARDHPVTTGLQNFSIHDEIYWGYTVRPDITPLISTTHPKSAKPLGWCRTEGKSRVVYLQLGHGPEAYANPSYQRLLGNSLKWTANK